MYEFNLSRMLAVAERDLRRFSRNRAFMVLPADFSADVLRGEVAPIGVVVDNTDNTSANVLEAELRRAVADVARTATIGAGDGSGANGPGVAQAQIDVQRVDAYGHKEFMQYLVPAVIALALFFVAMLAGGIILVDDRAKGIHEGYFVTPLSALDLVGGLTLSAITLSMIIGTTVLVSSVLIARLPLIG